MMKPNKLTAIRPLLLLFIVLSAFFVAGKNILSRYNINQDVLIAGNLLLIIVTVASCFLFLRSTQSTNPNSFIRAMYGSFILKFFLIALVAFVYIIISKKNVNKQALIACMILYVIYTFIEVSVLLKLMKQKKNA
jgi:hypothetical protein